MSEKLSLKQKIIKITNELRIGKEGKNTFAKYDYFRPDDILNALNPLLDKHGLIVIFNLRLHESLEYYIAELIIEETESDKNVKYYFDIDKAIVKGANPAQCSGATLTYGKRYSLMNAFNLADNSADFDSDEMTSKMQIQKNKVEKPLTENQKLAILDYIKELQKNPKMTDRKILNKFEKYQPGIDKRSIIQAVRDLTFENAKFILDKIKVNGAEKEQTEKELKSGVDKMLDGARDIELENAMENA